MNHLGFNQKLRELDKLENFENFEKMIGDWKLFIHSLQSSLSLLPGTLGNATFYRGQTFIPPDLSNWKANDKIIWTSHVR
jgi:hypothetical protein